MAGTEVATAAAVAEAAGLLLDGLESELFCVKGSRSRQVLGRQPGRDVTVLQDAHLFHRITAAPAPPRLGRGYGLCRKAERSRPPDQREGRFPCSLE